MTMSALATEEMSAVETGQMSGQMSPVETGQMSAAETEKNVCCWNRTDVQY